MTRSDTDDRKWRVSQTLSTRFRMSRKHTHFVAKTLHHYCGLQNIAMVVGVRSLPGHTFALPALPNQRGDSLIASSRHNDDDLSVGAT